MRRKGQKTRCEKRTLQKSKEVVRTYDAIQGEFASLLEKNEDVKEICCNVPLDGEETSDYTTDFICVKTDGDLMVRECVFRKYLMKPMTVQLLDLSREYWQKQGVTDWGIVIDEEKQSVEM